MKIIKTIIIFAIVLLLPFCKAKKTIDFCEGVSTEGKGKNCGSVFSTGELTALIKTDSSFTVSKLSINIYKKGKYKSDKVESLSIDVKPDESSARANFYFYDEGEFTVEVIGKENKKIAEGNIKVVDE